MWEKLGDLDKIIVVEDNPKKTFNIIGKAFHYGSLEKAITMLGFEKLALRQIAEIVDNIRKQLDA